MVEQTIGDFSFHLDGGKMITSVKAGRTVNDMIMGRWREQGLITSATYVKSSRFSGNADYNLTLGGHQEGESSIALQVLSGLTLFLLPYSVDTQFDLVYTLEHVETGRTFEAKTADNFRTIVGLLLLPITPFAMGGSARTYDRLADHLYNQLAAQAAFDPDSWPAPAQTSAPSDAGDAAATSPPARSVAERLRVLDRLRAAGTVTDEEYETKKKEILKDL